MTDGPEDRASAADDATETVDPGDKTQPAEGGREEAEEDQEESHGGAAPA